MINVYDKMNEKIKVRSLVHIEKSGLIQAYEDIYWYFSPLASSQEMDLIFNEWCELEDDVS
jgi:hypothetical protein